MDRRSHHAVSGQDQRALLSLGDDVRDHLPHESTSDRIHASRGLYVTYRRIESRKDHTSELGVHSTSIDNITLHTKQTLHTLTVQEHDAGVSDHGNGH